MKVLISEKGSSKSDSLNMDWMTQAVREGMIVILIVSGPLVLAAAGLGLIIGILQAATQVQEQTIGSAVKIIGLFLLLIVGGSWMFKYLNQYTTRAMTSAFTFVPRQGQKVVPGNAFKEEEVKNSFEQNLKSAEKNLKLLKPEMLQLETGEPPPIPAFGAANIPKPPAVGNVGTTKQENLDLNTNMSNFKQSLFEQQMIIPIEPIKMTDSPLELKNEILDNGMNKG